MTQAKSAERIYTIGYIDYAEHVTTSGKNMGNKSLKVTYHSGRFSCNQFVPFGGALYWQKKQVQEFMKGRSNLVPTTLEAALKLAPSWRKPKVMQFRPQKSNVKYFEVARVVEWQEEI